MAYKEVLDDLEYMPELVKLQIQSGRSERDVLESQYNSTLQKLCNLGKLKGKEAGALITAIQRVPFTPEMRVQLAAAIDGKSKILSHTKGQPLQNCLNFEQYLTEPEWEALRSNALIEAKIAQLAQRAWSIGLTCPSEPTSFRITAILVKFDTNKVINKENVQQFF